MSAVDQDTLAPLFAPLTTLRGIGPALSVLLGRVAGGERVIDLLFHMPDSYIDRSTRPTIATARPGTVATLAVEVTRHEKPGNPRQPWRVIVTDGTGTAELVFFQFSRLAQIPPGTQLIVSGRVDRYGERLTMPHPDHIVRADQAASLPLTEPVWPMTAGLWPRQIASAMRQALERLPALPEWLDLAVVRREGWPSFTAALRAVQAPGDTPPDAAARTRLAYDELFAKQLAFALVRGGARRRAGRPLQGDGALQARALARFGHRPTTDQLQALSEIEGDMAAPFRMLRLLQGDVGAGKTLVAALAMLRAVEAGAQAALMAPTEVLAKQHHRTLSALCPVPVGLLTGSVKGAARSALLRQLRDGSLPIVVGTHALFQEAVEYRDLGLAVIDEQHRFGVHQRLMLGEKGERTDVLVMTATPIPRTLLLTEYGEMEVSRIRQKPAGRKPVRTTLHSMGTLEDVIRAVARKLAGGGQVFWVCPMVAESEEIDIAAAEARFAVLRARFCDAVGLAHGQQDAAARDAALAAFAAGETRLLVATTVIEVGVDVPAASVMVVEHAERFGLAQLHQLRGRVGRGAEASFCLLLHEDWLNETARARLALLRDTDDGFAIADADFRLRHGGDVLGTKQAGLPGWKLADWDLHRPLLDLAFKDAAVLMERDPALTSPRGRAAGVLLRLFEQHAAARTVLAG